MELFYFSVIDTRQIHQTMNMTYANPCGELRSVFEKHVDGNACLSRLSVQPGAGQNGPVTHRIKTERAGPNQPRQLNTRHVQFWRYDAAEDANDRRRLYKQKRCDLKAVGNQRPPGMATGRPGHHAQGQAILKHIKNIYKNNELKQFGTVSVLEIVQNEGNGEVLKSLVHYNLDIVLSVGYRINTIDF